MHNPQVYTENTQSLPIPSMLPHLRITEHNIGN